MISVCMPYFMRQPELDRSLAAYRRLYTDLEISICDDGSPEPVVAPGCVVTRLPTKDFGLNPSVPLNIAVRASTRDVIVLTNPEVEHVENVLDDMLSLLESENDYVTAACRDADGTLLAGEGVDYRSGGRLPVPVGSHFHFCAMLHRSLFDTAGGFDETYRNGRGYEDADWLWRLNVLSVRFRHCPKVVKHYRTKHKAHGPLNRELFLSRWGPYI